MNEETKERAVIPWYVIVGLMLVLSVVALLLFARPLDTSLKEGEEPPAGYITGPSQD